MIPCGVVVRFSLFLLLWLVLDSGKLSGLVVGIPSAALTAWISLHLAPPGVRVWNLPLLPVWLAGFVWDSVVAGCDVALRAFNPRLPIRPGFVTHRCQLPPGPQRDFFLAMSSLLPGSLPIEEADDGTVTVHCLDTTQPVAAQLSAQEARLKSLLKAVSS